MAGKKKVKVTKVKKKKWVQVIAPKLFNNVVLGETNITEDEQVLSKSVKLNLGTVTNDMRKQGYVVKFDVTKLKEGKAQTALVGLTMTPSGMKRLIRRGRTKIEDSFLARLKGGEVVRVKPLIVTINTASKAAQTTIRLNIREKIKSILSNSTLDAFVGEVLQNKMQKTLKDVAMQNHPTRTADIKAISLLPKYKAGLADKEEEVEAADESQEATEEKTEEAPKKTPAKKTAVKKAAKKTAEKAETSEDEAKSEEE